MSDMSIYSITNEAGQSLDKYDVDDKLKELGIPEDIIAKGESAINDYAFEQNIDLTSLQPDLTDKDASSTINGTGDKIKSDFEVQLKVLGIPTDIIEQGKEAVKMYAASKGIILPNPPSGAALNIKS